MNALIKEGFTKCIIGKNAASYRLPNGNYFIESDRDIVDILRVVTNITRNDTKAMIVLTEVKGDGLVWAGLGAC